MTNRKERDITGRKRSVRAEREKEARMKSLFRAAPIGIGIVSNPDRLLLDVNDQLCAIVGYSRAELVGQNARMLYASDQEYERVGREKYLQISERGKGAVETRFRCKDGGIIDVSLSSAPLDPEDLTTGVTFTVLDISERKRHESVINHQARRSRVLLDLPRAAEEMSEADFLQHGLELAADLTGSEFAFIYFVNEVQETIELAAWSRNTFDQYRTAMLDTIYPVKQAGIWADGLRQRKPVVFNDCSRHPDIQGPLQGNAEIRRLVSLPVIDNGKVVMLAGVGNQAGDYTDLEVESMQLICNEIWNNVQRRRFIARLKDNQARYRELVDKMGDGVAVYEAVDNGHDFVFREHNRGGEKISNTPREQVIGRRVTEVYPGIENMGLLDVFRRVWSTGKAEDFPSAVYEDERLMLWVDNYVFKLPSGELVAIYEDITQRKQAEVRLAAQLEELSRWQDVVLGREMRGLELKHEVNELLAELGRSPRYPSAEADNDSGN